DRRLPDPVLRGADHHDRTQHDPAAVARAAGHRARVVAGEPRTRNAQSAGGPRDLAGRYGGPGRARRRRHARRPATCGGRPVDAGRRGAVGDLLGAGQAASARAAAAGAAYVLGGDRHAVDAAGVRVAGGRRRCPADRHRRLGRGRLHRGVLVGDRARAVGVGCRGDRSEPRRGVHPPDAAVRRRAGGGVPRRGGRALPRRGRCAGAERRLPRGPEIADLGTGAWAAVAFIAVFSSAIAHALWVWGVAAIGPNRAGVFIHLMPLFGAVLAVAFLGEVVAPFHVAGAALVLSGVFLAGRK